ncbi:MAG: serine/threonine-protein kinase [bacterium]|nr:serine/threonine-protein kinase [bacterium]
MIGKYLSGYKINKYLTSTDFTDIYLGIKGKTNVIIKILQIKPDTDQKRIDRFFHEAEIMKKLSHENIPKVYDFGEKKDSQYIILEYIDGYNLRELIKAHGAISKDYISIILKVCDILGYIHKKGVIHQDIKSRNIILTKGGDVKIIDFGLAYEKDKYSMKVRERAGTPHYMSPEQVKGYRGDERSDIYSLGVVMYELATGRRPFNGETLAQIVSQQLNMSIKPPRVYNQEIFKGFEDIVLKTLNIDPAERYQSIEELVLDIERTVKTTSWIDQERRKYPRYTVNIGVELRLQNDLTKHLIGYYGYTKDISLGGVRIRIPRHKDVEHSRIKEKMRLQVRIPVLDIQKYLELNGQIIWHLHKKEDCNIGIQFVSNDKEREESLSKFVESIK